MIKDVGHISDTEKVCLCSGLNNHLSILKIWNILSVWSRINLLLPES